MLDFDINRDEFGREYKTRYKWWKVIDDFIDADKPIALYKNDDGTLPTLDRSSSIAVSLYKATLSMHVPNVTVTRRQNRVYLIRNDMV